MKVHTFTPREGTTRFQHRQCGYYINEYYIGFRLVSPQKGDTYEGKKFEFHSIVFMLEGEVLFSYDEFLNHHFRKGDLFLTPQASAMYGYALKDSHMLVLTFNTRADSLCDFCSLSNYIKEIGEVNYDFTALRMTDEIWDFARLMEGYIKKDMRCAYLHQLKQRELFVILQYCYSEQQVLRLLFPAMGMNDFKSWILEHYTPRSTMSELAGRYNMTPKSFSRKFHTQFGMTFTKWMLKQKAKHIKLKLSMPDTTFNDIVEEFGFANIYHFYNFCKEQYGCTAKEFLAQVREKSAE